jgi:drug/metabolite transporter (DMT)-like permease
MKSSKFMSILLDLAIYGVALFGLGFALEPGHVMKLGSVGVTLSLLIVLGVVFYGSNNRISDDKMRVSTMATFFIGGAILLFPLWLLESYKDPARELGWLILIWAMVALAAFAPMVSRLLHRVLKIHVNKKAAE